jgi:hypothetical protein
MGLNGDLTIKYSDIIIATTPGLVAKCAKGEYSLICMNKLDLIASRIYHYLMDVSNHVTIVRYTKINNLLYPAYVLKLDTVVEIGSVYKRG